MTCLTGAATEVDESELRTKCCGVATEVDESGAPKRIGIVAFIMDGNGDVATI